MFSSTLRSSSTNPWDSRRTSCRGLVGCGRRRRDAPGPSVDEINLERPGSQKIGSFRIGNLWGVFGKTTWPFFKLFRYIKSGAGLSSIIFLHTHFLNMWPVTETFHMACLNRWLQWKVSGNKPWIHNYVYIFLECISLHVSRSCSLHMQIRIDSIASRLKTQDLLNLIEKLTWCITIHGLDHRWLPTCCVMSWTSYASMNFKSLIFRTWTWWT